MGIANEPNNRQFWPTPLTIADFYPLYDEAAKALRAALPTLKIGGPGWGTGGCNSAEPQAMVRGWLDYVKAANSPIDFLSFHVYSSNPDAYLACAQFYWSELDSRRLTAVELHISEWNTPDGADSSAISQLRYNAQGAAAMTAAWIKLQGAGVTQSTFYSGTDPAPNVPEFYGMFNGDGRTKKIAEVFSLWRAVTAYPRVLQSSGGTTGTTMPVAESDVGARAILIPNLGTTPARTTISFADGKTLGDYQVSSSTVSDSAAGEPLAGSTLSVPAKSTVLLRLTPLSQSFAASATATGTASSSTIALGTTLEAADVGKQGFVYVIALAGTSWYVFNGFAWSLWSGGDVAATFKGDLPPSFAVTRIAGFDVRGLSGTQIFVGYGTSFTDMVSNARFKMVYRMP